MRTSSALVAIVAATISTLGYVARSAELIDPAALGFGAPAFTLDTTVQGQLDYQEKGGGSLDLLEVRTIIPLGKIERGNWLFGAALNYSWTHADFGALRGLGTVELQTIEATLVASFSRETSPWWVLAFVSPGISTDFSDVGSDSFNGSALGLLGYRLNPRLDLAIGVFAGYSLGEESVMASAGFIWRPDDQWIVQATPPIVAIGWQPSEDWTISAVGYPGGGSWEVGEKNAVRQIDLSLWRVALSVERKLGEHWRISARAGVAFAGELELRDSDARVLDSPDLDPAPFGAVAIKWAF
jgi:hypothetical protein